MTAFQPFGDRSSARQMKLPAALLIEDVDAAEVLEVALDHLVHLLGLPHVELHGERIEARVAQRRRIPLRGSGRSGCR